MKILIVEDERLAVDKLMQVIRAVRPEAEVIAVKESIASTVSWLREHANEPDLVLMDIELADGQSFAIFEQATVPCPVIFVTSYDEYALRAFKVNSIDYLLKPIQRDELRAAFEKFDHMHSLFDTDTQHLDNIRGLLEALGRRGEEQGYRKRFLVKESQKLIPVDTSEVSLFYYSDRATFLKTMDGSTFPVDYSLDEIEAMVPPEAFFRINRGMLVAARSIQEAEPYFGNRLGLKLTPSFNDAIVSREKVADFKLWLGK